MNLQKSFHSAFTLNKRSRELKDLILPQINYVKSHGLLRRTATDLALAATCDGSFGCNFLQQKTVDVSDVTSKEVRSPDWIRIEEDVEEKTELENVKLLDRWVYSKNIHKQNDTEYRRVLRQVSNTQLSALGPDLFSNECDSFIVTMISQQLRLRKQIETEKMRDSLQARLKCVGPGQQRSRSQAATSMCASPPPESTGGAKAVIMKGGRETKLDNELRMELQCLRLKKELYEHKGEQRVLFAENDRLVREIRELKSSLESMTVKKLPPRRYSMAREDPSFTSRTSHASTFRRGSMSITNAQTAMQEMHQRYINDLKEKEKRDSQISDISQRIESSRAQYDCNMEIIHKLDSQLEQIKPEIKALLQNQIDYYYNLLYKGEDSRNMGLSWIIKTIWYLGGKLHMQRFPKILDADSVKYLINIATTEIERDKLTKLLKSLAAENRKLKLESVECVMQPAQGDERKLQPHYSMKAGSRKLRLKDDQEASLETQIFGLSDVLRELRRDEVERLNKLFLHNELRKKPQRNSMYNVLCAEFGEDQGRKEFAKMMKKLQDIVRNWEKCKSYAFVRLPKKKRGKKDMLFEIEEPGVLDTVAAPI